MDTKFKLKHAIFGDRKWLEEKYLVEKLSLSQIAELVGNGCTNFGVSAALVRNGIRVRTKGEGLRNAKRGGEDHFVFDESIITGALLGDGGLRKNNNNSKDSFPGFHKCNINYDHITFVAKQLFRKDYEKRIRECENKNKFGGGIIFRLTTHTHEEFVPLFESWYPAPTYKKVIPKNIKIDEKVLLHWFLDDGYSYRVLAAGKYPYVRVQFATQSFTKEDLDFLCGKIYDKFGLKLYPRFHQKHGVYKGTGYYLELSQSHNKDFYNIIGPPPVESLAYKWKL